ncbi:hypothetical protein FGG78_27990 [Thioclava sp. BHET1]|nr:hypothetical protein FGG78_27990 [Thioclava sp. BHET1]
MSDFTAHRHPVLAVRCPTCGKAVGLWCIRPSGHQASDLHSARKGEADRVFIAQHGKNARIVHRDGEWQVDPGIPRQL